MGLPEAKAALTASIVVRGLLLGFNNRPKDTKPMTDADTKTISSKFMPSRNNVKAIISGTKIPLII